MTACVEWSGARTSDGYGTTSVGGKTVYVHRLVMEPVPPDHEVHHRCQNPPCFNRDHLEVLPAGVHKRLPKKFGCPKGHPIDGVYRRGRNAGKR